jgi:hypothetical protein
MSQNIYGDTEFFAGYATLDRPVKGSTAEHIAAQPGLGEEKEWPMLFVPHARKPAISAKARIIRALSRVAARF